MFLPQSNLQTTIYLLFVQVLFGILNILKQLKITRTSIDTFSLVVTAVLVVLDHNTM